MSGGNALDFEEEYQLISSAKEKNDRNLDDSINSLKTIGARHAQPVRQQVQQAYVPVQHQAYVPTQPQASGLAKQTHIPVQEAQQVQIQATQKKAVAPASASSSMPDASSIEMYTDQN